MQAMQVDSPDKIRNVAVGRPQRHREDHARQRPPVHRRSDDPPAPGRRRQHHYRLRSGRDRSAASRSASAPASCPWRRHKVNLLDCPGYGIFFTEAKQGLRAADAALLASTAWPASRSTPRSVWKSAAEFGLPAWSTWPRWTASAPTSSAPSTRCRKPSAAWFCRSSSRSASEPDFEGVVDLVRRRPTLQPRRQRQGRGDATSRPALPRTARAAARHLIEAVAESRRKLMERFFETGAAERRRTSSRGLRAGRRHPPALPGAASPRQPRHRLVGAARRDGRLPPLARRPLLPGPHPGGDGRSSSRATRLHRSPPWSSRPSPIRSPARSRSCASSPAPCRPTPPVERRAEEIEKRSAT